MTKQQAVKKVQGSIDRILDVMENSEGTISERSQRILDSLRELGNLVDNSKSKDGRIITRH